MFTIMLREKRAEPWKEGRTQSNLKYSSKVFFFDF